MEKAKAIVQKLSSDLGASNSMAAAIKDRGQNTSVAARRAMMRVKTNIPPLSNGFG